MNTTLPLALRPQRLSDLVGQKRMVEAIRKQMASRPPQAFLLFGATGCGKTTVARIIATAFQCTHQKLWGDPCDACINTSWVDAVHEVNASQDRGIEEIDKLVAITRAAPFPPALKRVIIMDEAQGLTKPSQGLLLKHTEEPPPSMVWIICTTDPPKLLPTLRRRFEVGTYQLNGLSGEVAASFLAKAAKGIGFKEPLTPLLELAEQHQVTSPALLLAALEKLANGATAEQAVTASGASQVDTFAICKAVTSGSSKELRRLLSKATAEEARWIRGSVGGWLRACFMRESDPKRLMAYADSMQEIADGRAPYEDAMLLLWVVSTVYKIGKRFAVLTRG